jgi:hypothetical protein
MSTTVLLLKSGYWIYRYTGVDLAKYTSNLQLIRDNGF